MLPTDIMQFLRATRDGRIVLVSPAVHRIGTGVLCPPQTVRDPANSPTLPDYPRTSSRRHALGLGRTIAQNIAYGAAGLGNGGAPEAVALGNGKTTDLGGGVTMDKVVEAAEFANARDFVEEFPDG